VSKSVLYFSMSVDGYIAGPNDRPGNPGGDGFDRLHRWFVPDGKRFARPDGAAGELYDEMQATGAVLTGRHTAEQASHWGGDIHGAPIFVLSHHDPSPSVAAFPLVRYVKDGVVSAMEQAKTAARGRNVMVHGAVTAQGALAAGVVDELAISVVPVLFGAGRRLFDLLPQHIELEVLRVIDTPEATHIRYGVR
jgi:dihydrofolate reductase